MGPLVPDVISQNLNYIFAIIIGMIFGAILEQAGFSSAKKLVGLFYGYDFTVLRVFFTAGIVAMVGVMGLSYFGLIDLNLIYINPLYLWSAIIGGFIMGLGFILGGYCPGTSICAAAIGKIDAIVLILGTFVGVLIFGEFYSLFENLYTGYYYGTPRIFETLKISQNSFAFFMVLIAFISFYIVTIIENRINRRETKFIRLNKENILIAFLAIMLLISSLIFKDRKELILKMAQDEEKIKKCKLDEITVDELALMLLDKFENKLQIIDFRNEEEFKEMSLPRSIHFKIDNLFEKEPKQILLYKNVENVFIANTEDEERKIGFIAKKVGYKNFKILKGGFNSFKSEIIEYKPIENPRNLKEEWLNRFREKAKIEITEMIKNNKPSIEIEKKQKRALGGC